MLHQTFIYLLVFTSVASLGYKPLSKYTEFQKKSEGGAVFQWAPDEEVTMKGVVGNMNFKFNQLNMKVENDLPGRLYVARTVCFQIKKESKTSNRLNVRILGHGYGLVWDEVELDEFVVTECDEKKLKNMFVITRIDATKYALTFKATNNKCFKREIEVIEGELTLTVHREEPVEQDQCPESSESLNTKAGSVVPKSWMDNGDLFDLHSSKTSRFKMEEDDSQEATSVACREVEVEGQTFNVTEVLYRGIPVDRLVTKDCSEFLDKSYSVEKNFRSKKNLHIYYLNTKNECRRRKYDISVERVEGDDFRRRVTMKRYTPTTATCWQMKRACKNYRTRSTKDTTEEEPRYSDDQLALEILNNRLVG